MIDTVEGVVVNSQDRSVVHQSSRQTNEISAADAQSNTTKGQSQSGLAVVEIS